MTDKPAPADELRAAAEKLRALARAALGNCRPWRHAKGIPNDSVRTETGWEVAYGDDPNNLRYIAAMNPNVGLALADWLTTEAETWAGDEVHYRCSSQTCTLDAALAVARAINGGQR